VPARRPPLDYHGTPCRRVLPAGTQLHRVHNRKYSIREFVPKDVLADPHWGGGRFDPTTEDAYPYWYAAFSRSTALAELLLRDIPFDEKGARLVPRAKVRYRRISTVGLANDLTLLALTTGTELAAVAQDEWLIHTGPEDYGKTRRWAHWLRRQAPWAQGLVWPSKRDVGEEAVILFGDRCRPDDLSPAPGLLPPVDLWTHKGGVWLNEVLDAYQAAVPLPSAKRVGKGS
jgi:hypothetical protein